VFQGSSALTLDAKGRLSIPTRHRDALLAQCEGKLTLTRQPPVDPQAEPEKCLLVYPRSVWADKREEIEKFPAQARRWKRMLLGSAQDVELDGSGRILIAPELREAALLTRDVMLLGMGRYFELWDVAEFKRCEAEDMAKGIPAGLENFSF